MKEKIARYYYEFNINNYMILSYIQRKNLTN